MTLAGSGHDQKAAAADRLTAALHGLRLEGAIFFRGEFTERWAFQSVSIEQLVPILRPGAKPPEARQGGASAGSGSAGATRLVIFHIVAAGRSWVQAAGGERLWAKAGEVIVVPYGDQHSMGGWEAADEVPIIDLLARPPWLEIPP